MELSKRLQAVANMVSEGSVVCDAGCDHGYVSIYLVQEGISPHVIAMDVNAGPLAQARAHIEEKGLSGYIETRLSDGVAALRIGEADALILAGMGGRLIMRILTDGKEKTDVMKELILQPQSEIEAVRVFLQENGYRILAEDMVYEDGKYYPMMKVLPKAGKISCAGQEKEAGRESHNELSELLCKTAYDRYGALLLKNAHPVLHQFLLWEQKRDEAVAKELLCSKAKDTERGKERQRELLQAGEVRACALSFFGERSCNVGN